MTRPEPSVVGVLGEGTAPVRTAIEAAGGQVRTGRPTAIRSGDHDLLVAVGDGALLDLAAQSPTPDVPVVPVDAGPGIESVPLAAIEPAAESLLAGRGERRRVPILGAMDDGTERARALCELMLVTAEQARISEYAVWQDENLVDRFRADGVVVATPAGSHGYARSVGSPLVAPDTGVVSVVPIAPFATDPDHWVLPTDSVRLSVERDTTAVELLADDRRTGEVLPNTPLSIGQVDTLSVRVVPESRNERRPVET